MAILDLGYRCVGAHLVNSTGLPEVAKMALPGLGNGQRDRNPLLLETAACGWTDLADLALLGRADIDGCLFRLAFDEFGVFRDQKRDP